MLPSILGLGFAAGALAGFFGIGGGFLIVPALMLATGMPITYAIATSLVSITAFGLVTAANYALAGEVVWSTVGLFVAGGIAGGVMGQLAWQPPCLPQAPAAKPLCRRCIGRRCLHDLSGSSVEQFYFVFSCGLNLNLRMTLTPAIKGQPYCPFCP
jgi:hypothetical protein